MKEFSAFTARVLSVYPALVLSSWRYKRRHLSARCRHIAGRACCPIEPTSRRATSVPLSKAVRL